MRCIYFLFCLLLSASVLAQTTPSKNFASTAPAPPRIFDGQMKLQNCSIKIFTDGFTATTFMELEFYNPQNNEMEGLYRFGLLEEQIITGFQLELNGKYREGSIEEKWKATNAYNTIVGKRVDPALLVKEYNNQYSLRIYPVPAKKSRKVTITIQQMLKLKQGVPEYYLPLSCKDTTENFNIAIQTNHQQIEPFFKTGLLLNEKFAAIENGFSYKSIKKPVVLNLPVSFVLPSAKGPLFCTKKVNGQHFFALRFQPSADSVYQVHPASLHIFWDASSSGIKRNIKKEISFLKQYIAFHSIKKITIIPFSNKLKDTAIFDLNRSRNNSWENYLESVEYAGATKLGLLNFATVQSDMILLFSDGRNSIGNKMPVRGTKLIYAVHAAVAADVAHLNQIIGAGGRIINLNQLTVSNAIQYTSVAESRLMNIQSSSGKTIVEQTLPLKINQPVFINGTMNTETDTLTLVYGNNNIITSREKMIITRGNECSNSALDRIDMLTQYRDVTSSYLWNDIIDFGLRERVITINTAFIVLERVEDYIRYNIDAPKDLEEECRKLNYTKIDTREARRRLLKTPEETILSNLLKEYNARISLWDKTEKPLVFSSYSKPVVNKNTAVPSSEISINENGQEQKLQGKAAGVSIMSYESNLSEVVVVGYGSAVKRNLTYSVTTVQQRDLLSGFQSVEEALSGRVPGMYITSNSGQPGSSANIQIRGISSLSSSNQPLFVLDGIPVQGNINELININDIENITVVKGAAAGALYGSRASGGAIIITSKRGTRSYNYYNRRYRLKDAEDVDYLQEIKAVDQKLKLSKYEELRIVHSNETGFYFDMAQHLYEKGFKEKAYDILMEAAELNDGNYFVNRTIGFFLESWKEYDRSAELFTALVEEHPEVLMLYRDLAWTYYQMGNYQKAVDFFYKGILKDFETEEANNLRLKEIMLNEMNVIISMHKSGLDLSQINPSVLKPLPCDLRITAEDNLNGTVGLIINEPGNNNCSLYTSPTKNGGYIKRQTNDLYSYYQPGVTEYQMKNAVKGKYKVLVNYYGGSYYNERIPSVIRLIIYKNFGKPDQSVQIENVMMDNQYGEIEIAEFKW